jgi:hypothetical protein
MTNALAEFKRHTEGLAIKCAFIEYGDDDPVLFKLSPGYSEGELAEFLANINFEYDDGYGKQEIRGTIWYEDGQSWSERDSYDGSEWYVYRRCPDYKLTFS